MSPLKLNGSTSGFVALDAPAAAGSNTLVLPTGNGSNGQVLTTNGSGTLSWSTVAASQWTTTGSDIYYNTGKVLVGATSSYATYGTPLLQLDNSSGVEFSLRRSITTDATNLGYITAYSTHGLCTSIQPRTDGTQTSTSTPGAIAFLTQASGSTGSPTERMRIASDGAVFIAKTGYATQTAGIELQPNGAGYFTRSASLPLLVNRLTDDGTLIAFYQDTVLEGSISIAGTTVSYNGAHLSRYSQLPSGAEREEILRGTVLTNLDEMCEWGEEDNEQLNRMKVSDVEGDKNVSGVFQAWDDDDDTYTNDFYCAMTGDFIIRIAEGVTVERGDLLMSAGDGTAKPQDDDIIRSKTIAKVTSTHVTCTYDDGSYCVPCVLMAC